MSRPKKILILTADAGFGHRAAANAVAAALTERYGDACRVTVVNPLESRRARAVSVCVLPLPGRARTNK